MKMDIKVSIIIPVYNVAPYLEACLSSCINQTFQDIEIIVVNDGSRDDSSQIIAAYAAIDERIQVITKENEGLIYARKSGLDVAYGEYVFHLDGDDYIETNTIEELYNEALRSGSDYVSGGHYDVWGNNKYKVKNNNINGLSGQDLLYALLFRGFRIWGILMRRSLFDNLVYYPVFMGEDLFFNMQIALKVRNTSVVDKYLYNYINRSGSVTKQKDEELLWLHNVVMVRAIFYLLDVYSYNQRIRDKVYLMFFPFYLHGISQKRTEIKTILYEYYWSKKKVMDFLWRKRKDYYLIVYVFFRFPLMGSLIAKVYTKILSLWRKYRLSVFRKKNQIKS